MIEDKTVLVVEDEFSLMRAVLEKFKNESFTTLQARNGVEGLAIALKEHPDLILLDIMMPKMDGISLLRELRKDVWGKDAKVVMLTNLSDNEKLAEAEELGIDDFFIKTNLKIEDILKKVLEKLNKI